MSNLKQSSSIHQKIIIMLDYTKAKQIANIQQQRDLRATLLVSHPQTKTKHLNQLF